MPELRPAHSNFGALAISGLAGLDTQGLWALAQRTKVMPADLDRTGVSPVQEAELALASEPHTAELLLGRPGFVRAWSRFDMSLARGRSLRER